MSALPGQWSSCGLCTCKSNRRTHLGPCSLSSSRLRVLLRSHHNRQKILFFLYRNYCFQKTNCCWRSNCKPCVDSWRDDSSSLLLLLLEIAGVIWRKILEDIIILTDHDTCGATQTTSLSSAAARLNTRHHSTRLNVLLYDHTQSPLENTTAHCTSTTKVINQNRNCVRTWSNLSPTFLLLVKNDRARSTKCFSHQYSVKLFSPKVAFSLSLAHVTVLNL